MKGIGKLLCFVNIVFFGFACYFYVYVGLICALFAWCVYIFLLPTSILTCHLMYTANINDSLNFISLTGL